jgi:acyl-CoA oxidase
MSLTNNLPATAMLGELGRPSDFRQNFLSVIWRVHIGTIALSTVTIPLLRSCAYAVGRYSIRRIVTDRDEKLVPIISFRTQQRPSLYAIVQYFVLDAFSDVATQQ